MANLPLPRLTPHPGWILQFLFLLFPGIYFNRCNFLNLVYMASLLKPCSDKELILPLTLFILVQLLHILQYKVWVRTLYSHCPSSLKHEDGEISSARADVLTLHKPSATLMRSKPPLSSTPTTILYWLFFFLNFLCFAFQLFIPPPNFSLINWAVAQKMTPKWYLKVLRNCTQNTSPKWRKIKLIMFVFQEVSAWDRTVLFSPGWLELTK